MKKLVTLIFIYLIPFLGIAQTPVWQWIKMGGSDGSIQMSNIYNVETKQIGTDANGNIYGISLTTSHSIEYDTSVEISGYGYNEFVVFSSNCYGKYRWMHTYGSEGSDIPGGIVVDPSGEVYVIGGVGVQAGYSSKIGDSIFPSSNNFQQAFFIQKLDSLGNTIYLKFPGSNGAGLWVWPIRVDCDKDGNPMVLCYSDTITLDGFSTNRFGHYIVKFDKRDGNIMDLILLDYQHQYPGTQYDNTYFSVDKEDNSIYLTTGVPSLIFIGNDTVVSDNDIYGTKYSVLAKFDSNGTNLWHVDVPNLDTNANTSQKVFGKPAIGEHSVFVLGNTRSGSQANFLGFPVNNDIADDIYITTLITASFNKNNGDVKNINYVKSHGIIFAANSTIACNNENVYISGNTGNLHILNQNDTIKPYSLTSLNPQYPFVAEIDTNLNHFNWGIACRTIQMNVMAKNSYLHIDHNNNILLGGSAYGALVSSLNDTVYPPATNNFFIAKIATTNTNCGCAYNNPRLSIVGSNNYTLTMSGEIDNIIDSAYIYWGDGDSSLYTSLGTDISYTYSTTGPWNVCFKTYGACGMEQDCLTDLYSGINNEQSNKKE